jgi:hypothetical protein
VQAAAAVDGPHPVLAAGQLVDQGAADAEHDLQVNRCGHGSSLRVGDGTTKPLRRRVHDSGHRDQDDRRPARYRLVPIRPLKR